MYLNTTRLKIIITMINHLDDQFSRNKSETGGLEYKN